MTGRAFNIQIAVLVLIFFCGASINGQDAVLNDNESWTFFPMLSARLQLGESPLEIRPLFVPTFGRDFTEYTGLTVGGSLVYKTDSSGSFSFRGYYVTVPPTSDGALFQLNWQKVWTNYKIEPLLRLTAGRLSIVERADQRRVELNYRSRLRVGISPEVLPNLKVIVMNEWFPFQKYGFSVENRFIYGLHYFFNSKFDISLLHYYRWRGFDEAPVKIQNIILLNLTFRGVIKSK